MSDAGRLQEADAAYRRARTAVANYRLPEARLHLEEARRLLDSIDRTVRFELDLRLRLTESWLICDDLGLAAALDQVLAARRDAEGVGRDDLSSLAHIQSGVLQARAGRTQDALDELRAAVTLSDALAPEDRVRLLINKGTIASQAGALDEAADDLRLAASMASGLPEYAFMATHNLGFVEYLRGDLPSALRSMAEADEAGADVDRSVARLDRARVLMEVGLVDEAAALLEEATMAMRAAGMAQELSDALLEQARCAMLRGRTAEAVQLVDEVATAAADRDEQHRELEARAVRLEALVLGSRSIPSEPGPDALADEAANVARAAHIIGDDALADRAAALRIIIAARLGHEIDTAREELPVRRMRDSPYLATRALGIRAQLALSRSTTQRASLLEAAATDVTAARSGMASLDLRTAIAIHITPVMELDVELAALTLDPWAVLAATERWRTALDSVPSVMPSKQPGLAALWSRLRQSHEELRSAPAKAAGEVRREVGRIERQLRERSWGGNGATTPTRHHRAPRGTFAPATILSYLWAADRLLVVRIDARQHAELIVLAGREEASDMVARATADANASARVPRGPLAAGVLSSLEDSLEKLDAMLLPEEIADGPVVIVPGGQLVHLPWGMLPRLRHRGVALSRSVSAWHSGATELSTPVSVAAAVGPGLQLGHDEVRDVLASWPTSRHIPGEPGAVAAALACNDVVHVAAHGEHRADNPLFSCLSLHGGALFAHELEGIPLASSLVVLSACSAGVAQLRPGDEALGLTSSLLAMGVSAVVAPLTDVPDAMARATMAQLHHHLAAGLDGPAALAAASQDTLARSFTWFGSNWRAGSTN